MKKLFNIGDFDSFSQCFLERLQSAGPALLRSPPQVPVSAAIEIPKQIPSQSSKQNQKPNKNKKKITKDDIGMPKDFRHEVHVGADGIRSICDTAEIRQFLSQAGLSEIELRNPKTKKDVEKFVRKNEHQIRQSIMMTTPPAPPTTLPPELPRRNTDSLKRDIKSRPVPPVPVSNPIRRPENSSKSTACAGPPVKFYFVE